MSKLNNLLLLGVKIVRHVTGNTYIDGMLIFVLLAETRKVYVLSNLKNSIFL